MKWFLFLATLFYILCSGVVIAQQKESTRQFKILEIKGHSGSHLYTGKKLKEALENGYGAVEVRYGWQSNNAESWQAAYGYPAYGFGWYSGFIGNPDLLGKPGAFYGFISLPLTKLHRHRLLIEPAVGLSYDLKPYDQETNADNDAIGSRFNVYFNLNLGASYRLNREMDLVYGVDFTHFSNGRMFKPNAGLNMWGFNLGFRYHFNSQQGRVDNSEFPQTLLDVRPHLNNGRRAQTVNKSGMAIYGATGWVQNDENSGTYKQYSTVTTMVEYLYTLNEKNGFAVGINGFYDSSLVAYYPDDSNYWFLGAHGGYDLLFWRMALRLQVGTYLDDKGREYKGNYFFRPALKYQCMDHLFVQLGLKTQNGFKADWIEFGLGIRLF